ncbi:PQQ-dependent sugar dehydrogenase [Pedobacter changchengzhani]|uniref:PQQ-dependent sugar dehydrogenase n=1 Tax=Pedobacter changchengzhani TaxID=2529274 RepID=A0A4R5MHB6_9SPHI|nr:PQQ-dependent sugar dehydrogenase [Pedobacter changchengzhani]TDG34902.1 PQQ-dependent sugar dehydrogenase [Pedobacter changchengzhani]
MVNELFYKKMLLVSAACIFFSCTNSTTVSAQNPVETNAPSADFKPAFEGQTRIAGVKTKTQLDISVINEKLENPWGLSVLPDGRFLISQKQGTMVILNADGKESKHITGFPKVDPSGQGGLLDVTIDPNFAKNRMVYFAYSEHQDKGVLLAIAKGKLSADETTIENVAIIYRATPDYKGKLQYGSRIVFDKNGNLFVSTGERSGADIRMQAQYLNSSLGKILHLTTEGKPVPNGPFADTADARPEIYALGLRNPDGLAINPQTGDLWEAEFGPKGGDEINIIKPGKNYGWPIITYGTEYSGKKVGDGIAQKEGMEQPIYYWNPSISPGCIAFYNSNSIGEWKGNLFVGALGGSHIIRLVIKNDKIVGEERLLEGKGERFRDMAIGKDGAIYSVTDGGKLYRIGKK